MLNVLAQANRIVKERWGSTPKALRIFIVVAIIVLGTIGIIYLVLRLFASLVRSVTAGGFRNADLYFPRGRRNR